MEDPELKVVKRLVKSVEGTVWFENLVRQLSSEGNDKNFGLPELEIKRINSGSSSENNKVPMKNKEKKERESEIKKPEYEGFMVSRGSIWRAIIFSVAETNSKQKKYQIRMGSILPISLRSLDSFGKLEHSNGEKRRLELLRRSRIWKYLDLTASSASPFIWTIKDFLNFPDNPSKLYGLTESNIRDKNSGSFDDWEISFSRQSLQDPKIYYLKSLNRRDFTSIFFQILHGMAAMHEEANVNYIDLQRGGIILTGLKEPISFALCSLFETLFEEKPARCDPFLLSPIPVKNDKSLFDMDYHGKVLCRVFTGPYASFSYPVDRVLEEEKLYRDLLRLSDKYEFSTLSREQRKTLPRPESYFSLGNPQLLSVVPVCSDLWDAALLLVKLCCDITPIQYFNEHYMFKEGMSFSEHPTISEILTIHTRIDYSSTVDPLDKIKQRLLVLCETVKEPLMKTVIIEEMDTILGLILWVSNLGNGLLPDHGLDSSYNSSTIHSVFRDPEILEWLPMLSLPFIIKTVPLSSGNQKPKNEAKPENRNYSENDPEYFIRKSSNKNAPKSSSNDFERNPQQKEIHAFKEYTKEEEEEEPLFDRDLLKKMEQTIKVLTENTETQKEAQSTSPEEKKEETLSGVFISEVKGIKQEEFPIFTPIHDLIKEYFGTAGFGLISKMFEWVPKQRSTPQYFDSGQRSSDPYDYIPSVVPMLYTENFLNFLGNSQNIVQRIFEIRDSDKELLGPDYRQFNNHLRNFIFSERSISPLEKHSLIDAAIQSSSQ